MTDKIAVELGNVQKTLFLPLWGRAAESQKPHPLLVDKTALAITQAVDYDFADLADNLNELTRIAWIMRSRLVDEVVKAFIQKYPRGTIVNIGCGLDTTFERVDNGRLIWYDLDLPDVIQLRRRFIADTSRRQFIAASFLDDGWLSAIGAEMPVLFVAAGVFYYFDEKDIRDFLTRLADHFPGSELLMDVSSPYGVKVANRMVITRSGLDEKSFLKWGLKSTRAFADWDERLRLHGTYFYFGKQARGLSLRLRLFGALSDFLKVQYLVHLDLGR